MLPFNGFVCQYPLINFPAMIEMMRQKPEALKFLVQVLKNSYQTQFKLSIRIELNSIKIPIGKADKSSYILENNGQLEVDFS